MNTSDYRVIRDTEDNKYIIVKAEDVVEDGFYRDTYDFYGNTGDDSLDYSVEDSDFKKALSEALNDQFKTGFDWCMVEFSRYGNVTNMGSLEHEGELYDFVWDNREEIEKFAAQFVEENETFAEATYYTYWDGSNNVSIVFQANGEKTINYPYELLAEDDETAESIIEAYCNGEYSDYVDYGTGHEYKVDSDGVQYSFHKSYYQSYFGIYDVEII